MKFGGVREAHGVHLVVLVIRFHQLEDERAHDRLEVIEAKGLKRTGKDFAGNGVSTEEGVQTTTLKCFNLV